MTSRRDYKVVPYGKRLWLLRRVLKVELAIHGILRVFTSKIRFVLVFNTRARLEMWSASRGEVLDLNRYVSRMYDLHLNLSM